MKFIIKKNRLTGGILPPANNGDTGWDLLAADAKLMHPGQTCLIDTGISIMPKTETLQSLAQQGFAPDIQIRPRSSMSQKGLIMPIGTIDNTFTGSLKVVLTNTTNFPYLINIGDKIAQLVFGLQLCNCELVNDEDLPITQRGANGFGSTGI